MKKMLIKIGCFAACASLLMGCSNKTPPSPTEEYDPSFVQEETVHTTNTDNVQNTMPTENVLVFGEQTYNDSVQINQPDLEWATYDTIPNDIFLMDMAIFPCGTCAQMPTWGFEMIDNVAISTEGKNIIAFSAFNMSDLPSGQLLSDELSNTLKDTYGIETMQVTSKEMITRDMEYWDATYGTLNQDETRPYLLLVHNDGLTGYVQFASWDTRDIYTKESMEKTIDDIWSTLNRFPLNESAAEYTDASVGTE